MPTSFYRSLGAAIRQRRSTLGMTQENLASRANLRRTTVTNIERGTQAVFVHQLVDLAKALGVAPAVFLPESEAQGSRMDPPELPKNVADLLTRLSGSSGKRES